MFEYLPLKVGETTGKLTLSNSDLGTYQYELQLQSTSPPPEKPVHFTTSLGSSQLQAVKFVSYARGRTDYTCKVSIHAHREWCVLTEKVLPFFSES